MMEEMTETDIYREYISPSPVVEVVKKCYTYLTNINWRCPLCPVRKAAKISPKP